MQAEGLWAYCQHDAAEETSPGAYLFPAPAGANEKLAWQLAVDKALGKTLQTLSPSVALAVGDQDHPADLLKKLRELFSGQSQADIIALHDRYTSWRCVSGGLVEYLAEMRDMRAGLQELGEKIEDLRHAIQLVKGLRDTPYESARERLTLILQSEPDKFTIELVERMFLAISRDEESDKLDSALAARMSNARIDRSTAAPARYAHGEGGRSRTTVNRPGVQVQGSGRCFQCLRFGHRKADCIHPSSDKIPVGHETRETYEKALTDRRSRAAEKAKLAVASETEPLFYDEDSEYPAPAVSARVPQWSRTSTLGAAARCSGRGSGLCHRPTGRRLAESSLATAPLSQPRAWEM